MKKAIPKLFDEFEKVRGFLWIGDANSALSLLKNLRETAVDLAEQTLLCNFYDYINSNKSRIVNYDERRELSLAYSSHVAESTVDHLLNKRAKKKQKMQWSRNGLHSVMQIRSSQASANWEDDWNRVLEAQFKQAA